MTYSDEAIVSMPYLQDLVIMRADSLRLIVKLEDETHPLNIEVHCLQ